MVLGPGEGVGIELARLQAGIDVAIEGEGRLKGAVSRRVKGLEPLAVQDGQFLGQVHQGAELGHREAARGLREAGGLGFQDRTGHGRLDRGRREVHRLGGGKEDQHGATLRIARAG